MAAFAVSQFGGNVKRVFAAFFHQLQAFHPALDKRAVHNGRVHGLVVVVFGAVKHGAVGEAAFVFHGYQIAFGNLRAGAFFGYFVLQAGFGGFHAFFGFVVCQVFFAGGCGFAGLFFSEFVHFLLHACDSGLDLLFV